MKLTLLPSSLTVNHVKASSSSSQEQREARRRHVLFGISCCYIFLFIGSFYGYGQMQLLLERNGAFSFLCPSGDDDTEETTDDIVCSAQTNALIRVQLIAQSIHMAAPLLGYGVDRGGNRISYFVLTAFILLGLFILFLSTTLAHSVTGSIASVDRWLYGAFAFMSVAVCLAAILIVPTGMLFLGRTQRRVISILNSLFDAGAITYLFLWFWYNQGHASIAIVLGTFFGIAVLVFGTGAYYWCIVVPEPIPTAAPVDEDRSDPENVHFEPEHGRAVTPTHPTNHTTSSTCVVEGSLESEEAASIMDISTTTISLPAGPVDGTVDSGHGNNSDAIGNTATVLPHTTKSYICITDRTRMQQFTSGPALCLAIFVGVHVTSNNWTMATIRDFLAYLGDDDYDNRYLTLFILLTPVSLLGLPFVDYIMHHYGFHCAFQCVNILGFAYTIIRLCSSNLNVQVLGFIIFAIFRCFLYSVFQSFVPTLFSPDNVGLCIGFLVGIPGVAAFLNVPLAKYIIEVADGNFYVANLMYTLLILPCVLAAYCIGRTIRREQQSRDESDPTCDDPNKMTSLRQQ